MSAPSDLDRALMSGRRAVLLTCDEDRALEHLGELARTSNWPVHTWSTASGIDFSDRVSFAELIHTIRTSDEPGLWIALDGGPYLHDPALARQVREHGQRRRGPALVVVDPTGTGPAGQGLHAVTDRIPELVTVVLPPPDPGELGTIIRNHVAELRGADADLEPVLPQLVHAGMGLERMHLQGLLREALLTCENHGPAVVEYLQRRKASAIDRAALLEPVAPVALVAVGGLDHYKDWLRRRRLALDPAARHAAIAAPRGVLLLGVPGCGKSWAARASADALGLPLVRLDPGRLFGGTVGASEANLRRLITTAERLAPVVLWLDEIDKGLAGLDAAHSDAGTTARVVGTLLTWLQERSDPVFVVATANRVQSLPPELLRRGRLDEIFFIDLPDAEQRCEILRVHLELLPARSLGQAPASDDPWSAFAEVATRAEGYSGAELESALTEARLTAFAERRRLRARDLEQALRPMIPLSVSHREDIERLRAWATTRARPG